MRPRPSATCAHVRQTLCAELAGALRVDHTLAAPARTPCRLRQGIQRCRPAAVFRRIAVSRCTALLAQAVFLTFIYAKAAPIFIIYLAYFPPILLWWPGVPVVLLGCTWWITDQLLLRVTPSWSPPIRYPVGAAAAALITLAIGWIALLLHTTPIDALRYLHSDWSITFVLISTTMAAVTSIFAARD